MALVTVLMAKVISSFSNPLHEIQGANLMANNNHSNNGKVKQSSVALLEKSLGQRDEFDSPEFEGSDESLPYIQLLNQQDVSKAGFFITIENAEAVQFQPSAEWQKHTTTFQNGDTAKGYRCLSARLLVLRRSPLLMFDGLRPTVGHRDSGDYLGLYQKAGYDRNVMVLKTRYLVFLLDEQHQPLHEQPLLLTAKGSFCGDLGDVYQKFRREMSRAFGQARNTHKPRGDKFMALSVMALTLKPELKGREKRSWVCGIDTVNHPTAEDWMAHFVGYDDRVKAQVYRSFEEWVDFGDPSHEVTAQAKRQATTDDLPETLTYEYEVDEEIEF
jgi:hypothetical protein